ncbi:acyl-CoA dehydrogenase family protein [Actinoplanes sp. DH11]|uniref:acyl-CoA dehydrogenase family protein n=1 Tax=Actinoplanes sp. DH11 TaxID=2857011 RepID=UPI002714F262|nr:acyl-CoA dehydrogenase family protein [Actinoplanes sp. DH11]
MTPAPSPEERAFGESLHGALVAAGPFPWPLSDIAGRADSPAHDSVLTASDRASRVPPTPGGSGPGRSRPGDFGLGYPGPGDARPGGSGPGGSAPGEGVCSVKADAGPGAVWAVLARLGVTGLAVPERFGGAGASVGALVVAAEELGHHAAPGPVAESLAAVPVLLAGCGNDEVAATWLPELAAGRVLAGLTAPPWLPRAVHGGTAGIVVVAGTDVVRWGRAGSAYTSMDSSRLLAEVSPAGVVAEGPALVPVIARALDLGALVCAAQLLGLGRGMLEASVEHARNRSQFGGPIGRFQAVQHRLADVSVALQFARPLLWAAAAAMGPSERDRSAGLSPGTADGGTVARDVSAAKVACGEAARLAARVALQTHGAIGCTREHGLGRWLTAARVLALSWGTPAQHRARIMTELARER